MKQNTFAGGLPKREPANGAARGEVNPLERPRAAPTFVSAGSAMSAVLAGIPKPHD